MSENVLECRNALNEHLNAFVKENPDELDAVGMKFMRYELAVSCVGQYVSSVLASAKNVIESQKNSGSYGGEQIVALFVVEFMDIMENDLGKVDDDELIDAKISALSKILNEPEGPEYKKISSLNVRAPFVEVMKREFLGINDFLVAVD